jgi:hypothetical protein
MVFQLRAIDRQHAGATVSAMLELGTVPDELQKLEDPLGT